MRDVLPPLTIDTGGKWKISIDGHGERWFDWSKASPNIGWSAMRGDCEWEPHRALDGSYQIVLIYDLTLKVPSGAASKTLDPEAIPLYQNVRKTLEHSSFMKEGLYFNLLPFFKRINAKLQQEARLDLTANNHTITRARTRRSFL